MNINTKLFSNQSRVKLVENTTRDSLTTGIQKIDSQFNFPYGNYLIVGQPGSGKSWFALWLARVFYKYNNVSSVYFSLEMSREAVKGRVLQQWSDLTKAEVDIINQKGDDVKISHFQKSIDLMEQDVIIIDNDFEESRNQMPEKFEAYIDEYYRHGYRVFYMDHFHEIMGANNPNTNHGIAEVWGSMFKKISQKYTDIWLFIFAQPNGEGMKKNIIKKPDISGSKGLVQSCDYFISLNKKASMGDDYEQIEEDRSVLMYVDKTRFTSKNHFGIELYFSETGNFLAI